MITLIIFVAIWLIISEVIYILFIKGESKEYIKEEWFSTKGISLIVAFVSTGVLYVIYDSLINYPKGFFIVLGSIGGLVLFFYINYKLGLCLAKKPKPKKIK